MKKKVKYILIAIGVALIIFGALIPTIFSGGNKDTFTYDRKSISGYYYCHVYVKTKEDYELNKAVITLKNAFNEYDTIVKTVDSLEDVNLLRKKDGDSYIYTITINLTSSEYFDYTKVDGVTLTTSIGERTAKEKELLSSFSWKTPVMVIVIFFGVAITLTGVAMIISSKSQKNLAEKARKKLAETNPEINTNNMTDEEVLAKQRELKFKEFKQGNGLSSLFGVETQPKEKVCEYCGASNSADAKKCSSCGASLKSKK